MSITEQELKSCIQRAGFPLDKRQQIEDIVNDGIKCFREYRTAGYYGVRGKPTKKPSPAHNPPQGRYDQTGARTVLISALGRAWITGFDKPPTLNNRNQTDSPFYDFAAEIMAREGIGNIHDHLEEYWSQRKRTWSQNDFT
jgi:hypothetical protein